MSPGYRERANGALGGVGNNGYSWASTVSDIYGMNLNFNSGGLNPSNRNNRAYGFQVRCLQAFIGRRFPFFAYFYGRHTEPGSGVPAATAADSVNGRIQRPTGRIPFGG